MKKRYMITERFLDPGGSAIYQRVRECGRMIPVGLTYLNSWVTADRTRCFQLMECEDSQLLDQWMRNWSDLVEFEVAPVISSDEASQAADRAGALDGSHD